MKKKSIWYSRAVWEASLFMCALGVSEKLAEMSKIICIPAISRQNSGLVTATLFNQSEWDEHVRSSSHVNSLLEKREGETAADIGVSIMQGKSIWTVLDISVPIRTKKINIFDSTKVCIVCRYNISYCPIVVFLI